MLPRLPPCNADAMPFASPLPSCRQQLGTSGPGTTAARNGPRIGTGDKDCAKPLQPGADSRGNIARLTLAWYNTEFLFDGKRDPLASRWRGNPVGVLQAAACKNCLIQTWVFASHHPAMHRSHAAV